MPKDESSDFEIKKKGKNVEISNVINYDNSEHENLSFTFENLNDSDYNRNNEYYEKKSEELMAMHQAFYKQIDPIQIVLRGAILKCTHSSDNTYIKLDTLEDFGVYSHKHPVVTCTDCKKSENIFNFGLCGNSSHNPVYNKELPCPTETGKDKNGDIRHVCIPLLADEWVIGDRGDTTSIYIDKETCEIEQFQEALLTNASLLCYYGGIITIVQNPEEEIEEEIKKEEIKDEIKTGDVQIAPWLYAYKGEPDIEGKKLVENFNNDEKLLTKKRKEYGSVDWYAYEEYVLRDEYGNLILDKFGNYIYIINHNAFPQFEEKNQPCVMTFDENGGFVNEDGRYWVAVGLGILVPGYEKKKPEEQTVSADQFEYGTEIDVVLEKRSTKKMNKLKEAGIEIDDGVALGERVYIKCVVGDIKNHTYDKDGNSRFQTGLAHPASNVANDTSTGKGAYIEFIYEYEDNGIMSDYNVVGIIVYEREW